MSDSSYRTPPAGHGRLVTAVFDQHQQAEDARQRLQAAGLPDQCLEVIEGATPGAAPGTGDDPAFWTPLSRMSLPEADRHACAEALSRGGSVIVADHLTEAEAAQAVALLSAMPAVEMDAREAEWRDQGWSGMTAGALPGGVRGTTRDMAYTNPRDDTDNYEGPSMRAHTPDADGFDQRSNRRLTRDRVQQTPRVRCYVEDGSA